MARGRSTDHAGSINKGRSRSQSKTRKLKCYHCHKEGHYRNDCPERKWKKKDNSKTADVRVAEDNSDGADVLSVTISSSDGGWNLDTGCSYHMCPNRDWFATYRSFDGGKVLMGNDVACKVVGIAMAEEGKGKIEKFNGMNFQWWKIQVEDYLYQKDLYLPLVGEKPEAMNASEWAILDRKALATVRLSLTPQVAFNISKEKTIAAVMKALKKLYEKPSVSNKALLFMCSLPDSWNNLVTIVSNSTISGTLTLNDVVSSVMNDEMRIKTIGDGISSSTALSVESRGRQNNKQNNRGRSPTRGRSKSRGKSKSKGRTIVCWNRNKEGHKKNDCTEPKKKKGAGGRQGDDEGANMVSSNERTYDDLCLSATVDDNSKVWYVDSGASIHCTPHRDCFSDYVNGDYGHVTVGNGYRCSIVGKGKVKIKLSNGGTLILNDVRHIPELQKNLISVSGLDREGYFVAFGEKQWKVTKGSMVVARGERVGTLYTLSGTHNHSISLAFTENQRTTLWHHRLGHLSESGMKILHSKNALPGMKNIQLDLCEGCVYGKQKRVCFRRDGKERKTERLELVHTDVCGPTTVKSLGEDKEYMELDEPEDGRIPRIESPEVLDETTDSEIGAGDQQQGPETLNLRRSSRLEVRALDSLPIIPTDEDDGSHSTEENEEPQEQQYNIARNIPRREIRPPQKYGYADMVAYALSVA
ncbi:hypothetical protein RJ640_023178 [Escallonia rubra]|uniref:CCHC-type domain-containing protein n=1 Tax=Escallonia rubra TaxID=112253 RepID=A0AA88R6J4_9ASTE|nr:hypothetical protein RJ640_023178 [Escallonia rubra]